MELREFARQVLFSDALDAKLQRVTSPLTDTAPGLAERVARPVRPANLPFGAHRTAPAMPQPGAFSDPAKRAVAHHIMANHELQAVEVMAFMLLAFPKAPAEFRLGMADIMADEQRHTRMHVERAATLGLTFGDLPVNSYIWNKSQEFESVLDYLAGMPLTFEGRNLDHTLEFAEYFRKAGDDRSAALMRVIHKDEIEHVAFGIQWLRQLKPADQTEWEAYCNHLRWPLRPAKSKGETFQRDARLAAGLDRDFVDRLESATDE
ncbi:MAG: ferritin-like domain-containing protein [Planctomycetota bacterium]|nr:ferritin-like domain-containing protein [Planctomycetota bacterium]